MSLITLIGKKLEYTYLHFNSHNYNRQLEIVILTHPYPKSLLTFSLSSSVGSAICDASLAFENAALRVSCLSFLKSFSVGIDSNILEKKIS